MAAESTSNFVMSDHRRAVRLLYPAIQFRLPAYLLLISLAFALGFAWHTRAAFADLYAMVVSAVPGSYEGQIREQALDYLGVSVAILVGYVLVVLCFCLGYVHRLLGPLVAFRRQVHALRNGNYRTRVNLRRGDSAFRPLADELNELTQHLARKGDPGGG